MRILICAGEVSGDMHAAALVKALKQRLDNVEFRGFGGEALRAEGVELLYHTDQTAVVGFVPVLLHARFFSGMLRRMKREITDWKPDLVLTVDYPGMNLRLAAFAHERGITTIHYICPQVWAWHKERIPKIARILDHLICLFPFEPACFSATSLKVTFAGHPLIDRVAESRAEPPPELPWHGAPHRIALLPGSRPAEIRLCLPRMLEAARMLENELRAKQLGDAAFIVPTPTPKMHALAEEVFAQCTVRPTNFTFIPGNARHVLLQAEAAAVASGTATLEACLARCPTVLVYDIAPLNAWIIRHLITINHVGLANIVAGRTVMPELLQRDFTAANLSHHLLRYVAEPETRHTVLAGYDEVIAKLGKGHAAETAAAQIVGTLREKRC